MKPGYYFDYCGRLWVIYDFERAKVEMYENNNWLSMHNWLFDFYADGSLHWEAPL